MKIAIIGAGNIGGAIALGLMQSKFAGSFEITVSDMDAAKTNALIAKYPKLNATTDNQMAVTGADLVILAVKPWLVETVLKVLDFEGVGMLASVAAGIKFDQFCGYVSKPVAMFRVIPNTAIRKRASMSLI
ncbi:MAG: NAD(P)-binding domain-containing protein, partial [Bacteroidales bacterium]